MLSGKHFLSFLLSAFFFITGYLHGQVSYTPTYHPNAGNPGGLNNDNDFDTQGWTAVPGILGSAMNNQWSGTVNLPFIFEYFGHTVTSFKVSTNGLLTFHTATSALPNNNLALPTGILPDTTIACFWDEFTPNPPTGTNDLVYRRVFGSAPNRQLWVRWSSFEWGNADFIYAAVVLEESNNRIYIVDMYSSANSTSITATVGLQENAASAVQAGTLNTALTGAGPTPADNSYYEFIPFQVPTSDLKPVSLLAPDSEGCGYTMEAVTIQLTNVGQTAATGMTASFSVDGGAFVFPETIPGTISPGDTISYTFNALADLTGTGLHALEANVFINGDGNPGNDTLTSGINNLLMISVFPYQEDFENGPGGWQSGGINSSWELATPANDTIQGAASGLNAWITNASGSYNISENSYVNSPCFDLSGMNNPTRIAMNIWWESEFSWDGAVLQSSLDNGKTWEVVGDFGDPDNWYNDSTINGIPGGQLLGWSGTIATATGSNGWVRAENSLPASLLGQPAVRLRFAFGSDEFQVGDGFAFDDVIIAEAPVVNLGLDGDYCNGDSLVAGAAGQSYLWSTGDTTQAIYLSNTTGSAIIDSQVYVTVTDSFGFSTSDTILVSLPIPPVFSVIIKQDIICGGDSSGFIQISLTGNNGPYAYNWSNGQNIPNIANLPAGNYFLSVTDQQGCVTTFDPVSITENPPLEITDTLVDVSCFGLPDGSILTGASGGVGMLSYLWDTGDMSSSVSGLMAGNYTLTVTDSLGCSITETYQITEPGELLTSVAGIQPATCSDWADGIIDLNITGGTEPIAIVWNHGDTSEDPTGLAPGFYYATLTDSNGCTATTDSIEVDVAFTDPMAGFGFTISGGQAGFSDSSIMAQTYLWDFGDSSATSTQASPTHTYASNGVYTVTLIVSNPCGSDTTTREIMMETVSLDELAGDFFVELFPNPTEGAFTLKITPKTSAEIDLVLSDITGAIIWQKSPGLISSSVNLQFGFPEGAAKGLYFLRMISGEKVFVSRIMLE